MDSIRAAYAPADTEYLYYVLSDRDGHHEFCKTDAQFQKAKARYKAMIS
jgi:cell division protein YceG involved in septum cleavage